jgi:hypothetical protein
VIDATDLDNPNPTADTRQIFMGASTACGVAVDTLYQGHLTILGSHAERREAVIHVRVSGPGQLVAEQATGGNRLIQTARARVHAGGTTSLVLHPTDGGIKALHAHRPLKARVRIIFTPSGGISSAVQTLVVLKP